MTALRVFSPGYLIWLFFGSLFGFSCQTSPDPQAPTRPNIVLFLVDDMGWQDTSVPFWEQETPFNRRYRTPNMERLAAQGMKFTQAYATPVCSPTRISLMTGMNAARHRVTNWTLRKDAKQWAEQNHPNLEFPLWNVNGLCPDPGLAQSVHADALPKLLQQAGYHTIHVGKAHFGAIGTPAADPIHIGFDVNIAGHAAGGPGGYHGSTNFSAQWRGGDSIWDIPGLEKYHGQDIFLTEALTLETLSALDTVAAEQPFFLYLSHYAVHAPIEQDDRFVQAYLDQGIDSVEARYAALVEGMDKSLGDVMDYLDVKGLAEETIILFMSDNGGLSAVARGGEPHTHNLPLSSGKGSIHEGGIRVPMLVKWPGVVAAASVQPHPLIIEDFFPSILEMAGVADYQTVQPIDGQSFLPLLQAKAPENPDRAFFWHYPNHWGPTGPGIGSYSAVRQGEWKLIYYHVDQSFELFHLAEDLGETTNLIDQQPQIAQRLAKVLADFLRSVDAQMPVRKDTQEEVPLPEG
ncbi:MAG: sulfatase [Bacteroidota bacterium]